MNSCNQRIVTIELGNLIFLAQQWNSWKINSPLFYLNCYWNWITESSVKEYISWFSTIFIIPSLFTTLILRTFFMFSDLWPIQEHKKMFLRMRSTISSNLKHLFDLFNSLNHHFWDLITAFSDPFLRNSTKDSRDMMILDLMTSIHRIVFLLPKIRIRQVGANVINQNTNLIEWHWQQIGERILLFQGFFLSQGFLHSQIAK